MRFARLISIVPQESSLNFLHLVTQSLGELGILHMIIWDGTKNKLGKGNSSSQAKTLMFPATESVLNFLNNMIEFSSSGPSCGNVGPQIFTQTDNWSVPRVL
jgi:hypothetical protein